MSSNARRSVGVRLILVLSLTLLAAFPATLTAQNQKPDIIFILLDDMNADMLAHMERLQCGIANHGTTFENFFIPMPACCPSRTNFLLGKYSHNHGIWEVRNSPHGGWHAFRAFGHEENVVAKALQKDLGYKTAYMGKLFNWYPNDMLPSELELKALDEDEFDPDAGPREELLKSMSVYVPPYWSSWRVLLAGTKPSMFDYYGSTFAECDNCKLDSASIVKTQIDVYNTDYLRDEAVEFITEASSDDPLFLWIAPVAPHKQASGPYPLGPLRYQNTKELDQAWPRRSNLREADRGDKPDWIKGLPALQPTVICKRNEYFSNALRSLKAVEDLIFGDDDAAKPGVLKALEETSRLENAYIFIASDNGYHFGEHHLPSGKRTFFEEDIRIPLLVRGPGVPAGRVLRHLTTNVDLSSTFLELAGGNAPINLDGRSLVPLLRPAAVPEDDWRQAILLERLKGFRPPLPPGNSFAIRTERFKYIYYQGAEKQLYDLSRDPFEERSLHAAADQSHRQEILAASLADLKACEGLSCRGFENRKPEGQERRFVAALFNPCIASSGTCTTKIVWDTRFFAKSHMWIRTEFGDKFHCRESGDVDAADMNEQFWGGASAIRLDVYDTMTACDLDEPPPASDRVQSLTVYRAEETTHRATGQLVALPNPCFPDQSGRCQVTVFVKTANLDPKLYDRVEVRNQFGGVWRNVPINRFFTGLTAKRRIGRSGHELSLFPHKAGTTPCPRPCEISKSEANLGPRLDFENIYNIDNPPQ